MPIAMLHDTRAAIGADAGKCDSRSLFLDRFADPQAKDTKDATPRKDWFNRFISRNSVSPAPPSAWLPPRAKQLHARLMGRLLVNLAGGVMENANLLLDRYGLPIIPGSASKGCARRMALQALHDWVEHQENKGSEERPAPDDACAPCCEAFTTPAEMLAAIARIFGWTPEDWKTDKNTDKKTRQETTWKSDFAWAVHGGPTLLRDAQALRPPHPTFAGTIAFLSASPNRDPGLELDVVTPHHTEYYESTNPGAIATDTEDPVPVYFPAVKPQPESDHFTFPLIPLRRAQSDDLTHAKCWLANGLELLGLGAKTNAGYGWFDASESLQEKVASRLSRQKQQLQEEEEKRQREIVDAAAREQKRTAKEVLQRELDGLTSEQQDDRKIELLTDPQFDSKVRAFCKEPKKGGPTDAERQAIVRALRGSRVDYWQTFKLKATKGDLATVDLAIRTLSKTMNLGKMP